MQNKMPDINDMFLSSGDYPLENLNKSNRWVRLADSMPWKEIEIEYNKRLGNQKRGASNKPARTVVGALIVKHMTKLSDEETIQTICENPYMQYLLGLKYYTDEPVFTPELFVYIRKRLDVDFFNDIVLNIQKQSCEKQNKDNNDNNGQTSAANNGSTSAQKEDTHAGILKIDATCTDAEVRYPTDIYILEDASRTIERLVMKLSTKAGIKMPHTARKLARSVFVKYIKQKHKGKKLNRETLRSQLHYLSQDYQRLMILFGKSMSNILHCFNRTDCRCLHAISIVYNQQKEMFDEKKHSCENRIISIFQPHIRPIVRGKARANVEFGAKIGLSQVNGYSFIDHLCWNSYNESSDLELQLNLYKKRFGVYPEEVQADKIYLTKANRALLKEFGINCYCAPLGRPPKVTDPELLEARRKSSASRNEVEGAFGIAKRIFNANDIRAKLAETANTWIGACFFVKNLKKFLKGLLFVFFEMCPKIRTIFEKYSESTQSIGTTRYIIFFSN